MFRLKLEEGSRFSRKRLRVKLRLVPSLLGLRAGPRVRVRVRARVRVRTIFERRDRVSVRVRTFCVA